MLITNGGNIFGAERKSSVSRELTKINEETVREH